MLPVHGPWRAVSHTICRAFRVGRARLIAGGTLALPSAMQRRARRYFDLGVIAGVPLKFTDAGAWEVHGGVDMLWLGDNLKTLNRGGFKPIGVVGFSVTY